MSAPVEPAAGGGGLIGYDDQNRDGGFAQQAGMHSSRDVNQLEHRVPDESGPVDAEGAMVKSRPNGKIPKSSSGQLRICKACEEPLEGQFVRALGGTFHLACFKCRVRYRS